MTELIALRSPFAAPLHQLLLEVAVALAFFASLGDALRRRARGDRWPLVTWMTALCYGVTIELVSFNFFQNYEHAQFSVMFYHHKLPLYVTFLYPAFHYGGLQLVAGWRLSRAAEALLCGLAIVVLDVPFDIAGPDAGWWTWSDKDPNIAVRWLGVPINSYYWYLLFGAIYAALLRSLRGRLEARGLGVQALASLGLGGLIVVLGIVAFIPFHVLKGLHVPESLIVAAHLVGCIALALALRPRTSEPLAPSLVGGLWALHLAPLATFALLWSQGRVPDAPWKLAAIAAAVLGLGALTKGRIRPAP